MIDFSDNQAIIFVESLPNEKKQITIQPKQANFFAPISSFETKYPINLIEQIWQIKGAAYLCDELAREEDPDYVQRDLEFDLRAYFPKEDFAGKRILDFGSGSGASTMILARLFPAAEIVGVDLDEKLQSIAQSRLNFYGYKNVTFHLSPSGNELPTNIGKFDLVILSAVYEHLLPEERKTVIPLIWANINKGGHLFLNMTPHRYFPIEHHTTNLPLLNYLPDAAAYRIAKRFSKRLDASESWETYLRRGIRGATEHQILKTFENSRSVKLLEPSGQNISDRIDLWYQQLNQERMKFVKKMIKFLLKTLKAGFGIVLVPNLSLVFQKTSD